MTNNECLFCGAPLKTGTSSCEACGQPVPDQVQEPPEVPRSYIETPEVTEEQAKAFEPQSLVRQPENVQQTSEPIIEEQTQVKGRNSCLILIVVAALIIFIICCCMLISISVFAQNVDIDSLIDSGWTQVRYLQDA
jgi:hypothetical protein